MKTFILRCFCLISEDEQDSKSKPKKIMAHHQETTFTLPHEEKEIINCGYLNSLHTFENFDRDLYFNKRLSEETTSSQQRQSTKSVELTNKSLKSSNFDYQFNSGQKSLEFYGIQDYEDRNQELSTITRISVGNGNIISSYLNSNRRKFMNRLKNGQLNKSLTIQYKSDLEGDFVDVNNT